MDKNTKKINLIIDTDPGVDDTIALTVALNSEKVDVKLITTTSGNVGIDKTTRNALYVVEKFGKNVPVCSGAAMPLKRKSEFASFVHGSEGLGGFIPENPKTKALECDHIEKMYEIIKQNAGDITILELAPQTNLGQLFEKHPDCEKMISRIIFEGGSPYGKQGVKPHISFNISFDPEAADIVMKTSTPKALVPSEMGRYIACFSPEQKEIIKNTNKTGAFLFELFDGYGKSFSDTYTQTNDPCAVMYLLYPEIFSSYPCFVNIDTEILPGKTTIIESKDGNVTFVENVDREKFFELFIENLKNIKI